MTHMIRMVEQVRKSLFAWICSQLTGIRISCKANRDALAAQLKVHGQVSIISFVYCFPCFLRPRPLSPHSLSGQMARSATSYSFTLPSTATVERISTLLGMTVGALGSPASGLESRCCPSVDEVLGLTDARDCTRNSQRSQR